MNGRAKLLIVSSLLLLAGCGGDIPFGPEDGNDPTGPGTPPSGDPTPAQTTLTLLAPDELCSGHDPDSTVVSFEDKNLEAAVIDAAGGPMVLKTCRLVSEITVLEASEYLEGTYDDLRDPSCGCVPLRNHHIHISRAWRGSRISRA